MSGHHAVMRFDAYARTSGQPQPFAAHDRTRQLEAMAREPLDVLVIGGGITGVGCALDAVTRGLRVGIVEADDWASGTSSRSSKMIHGGLRYLAYGDVAVVRESLRERVRLQRNARHLVHPLSMLLPAYGRGPLPFDRAKIGAGLWLYDLLGHRRAAGALHRWRDLSELVRLVPNIALQSPAGGGRLRGAHHYHDGAADDARLVMSVLRSAVTRGVLAANGTPSVRLVREGGRVRGAIVGGEAAAAAHGSRDGTLELRARVVVNATGVWSDATLNDGDAAAFDAAPFRLVPSKGIHLTVRRDRAGVGSGIAFFEQTGNSNIFVEPWGDDLAFVGTTDAPFSGELRDPQPTEEEIGWLLKTANQFLRNPIERSDVVTGWAGLRALVAPPADTRDVKNGSAPNRSKDVSRRHLLVDAPGVVTIAGGKLTAYRAMAEDAIDHVAKQLGSSRRSVTSNLALDGDRAAPTTAEVGAVAERFGCTRSEARQLLRRHGSNVPALARLVERRPELAERVHPERPYLAVEAIWAMSHEQARGVADIVERRTRIALEVADTASAEAAVARLIDGISAATAAV
ncbi:MAG: dependent oxidoreductase [Thermoleophilia bacterium]|nr:dependent oxidoreductase [Thermoleophilia bacterium]